MQMDRLHEIAYLHRAEDSHAYRGSLRRADTMELIYVTYGGLRAQIGDSCFSGERDAVFVLPPQLNLHVSTEVRDTGYLCIGLELQQKGPCAARHNIAPRFSIIPRISPGNRWSIFPCFSLRSTGANSTRCFLNCIRDTIPPPLEAICW